MSRIFWDSMLFIYVLQDHPVFSVRAQHLLKRAQDRGDELYTSHLALGEVLAGASKSPDTTRPAAVRSAVDAMGFSYLSFGDGAIMPFARLRSTMGLRVADSIHLACAAAAGIDLFLTGDRQLVGLYVPGIQFVADFNTQII